MSPKPAPAISDAQRRARLVDRHRLARTAPDALAATRGLVALHSSDPATPFLSSWARVRDFRVEHLEDALYAQRALWRLHAMRRTLFVAPVEDEPVLRAGAAREVATKERRKLERWLAAELPPTETAGWIASLEQQVEAALARGPASTRELCAEVPALATEVTVGSGKWTTRVPVSSRVLFLMALDRKVVRVRPAGSWRSSQYGWATVASWFGEGPPELDEAAGRAGLAERYLGAYGPATRDDLRWWAGWTAKQTAAALAAAEAATVALESGQEAFVLPGDLEPAPDPPAGAALLPALDSTPMGWKSRDWYLGPHAERVYDRNGNAGPTVWVDGRVVGGWAQVSSGEVVYRLLEDVGSEAGARVEEEAAALTSWLAGVVVIPRFRTPLERELTA